MPSNGVRVGASIMRSSRPSTHVLGDISVRVSTTVPSCFLNIVPSPFWLSHYLDDRDHARARPPSTALSRCRLPLSFTQPITFLSLLHPASWVLPPLFPFSSLPFLLPSSHKYNCGRLRRARRHRRRHLRARWGDDDASASATRPFRAVSKPPRVEERRKSVACMRGRIVDLATNCYGYHVPQKALDCKGEGGYLLRGDPPTTLVTKHALHVWKKLSWTPPAPPIVTHANKFLKGKWVAFACYETGSLDAQHTFENLDESAKDGIVDELLGPGAAVFGEVANGGLLRLAHKGVVKVLNLKEDGKETLDRVVQRICEPAKGYAVPSLFSLQFGY
ncbi:hypothetical protein B0H19DRAFT_1070253 [Mycena capillaripes]|nr:hypothetical protein B0H19DRAFT_1070253 [Mycena capillaripes]